MWTGEGEEVAFECGRGMWKLYNAFWVCSGVKMSVRRASRLPKRTIYVIRLNGTLEPNGKYYLDIQFAGKISDTPEGLFKGMYQDKDVESQR